MQQQNAPSRAWPLVVTAAAFFMAALDLLVVITALPNLLRDLHTTPAMLEWTVNAYSLATAAGIVTAAALGDRFGRRQLFTVGLLVFSIASMACALAPSIEVLIAARALQGVGAAVIAPLSLTILTSAFPIEKRGTVVGIWGGLAGLAIAIGPLVGGVVTEGLSWHWIFWINVPIGLLAASLARAKLTETHGPATALDLPAVGLISVGALGVVWGLTQAGERGLADSQSPATLTVGIVCLVGFLLWERSASAPMLPLRLFRSRGFAAANLTAFLMNAALLAGAFMISQYLQLALGYSPLAAGLHFLPMTATPIVFAPLAGMLSDRIGPRPVMVVGMLMLAVGLGWIGLVAGSAAGYDAMVVPFLLAGAGVSLPFATAATASLSAVRPEDLGKASGATNTIQRFGGVFGVAITTAVFTANGQLTSPQAFAAGFRPAELTAALLAVLGAVAAVYANGRISKPAASQPSIAVIPPSAAIAH